METFDVGRDPLITNLTEDSARSSGRPQTEPPKFHEPSRPLIYPIDRAEEVIADFDIEHGSAAPPPHTEKNSEEHMEILIAHGEYTLAANLLRQTLIAKSNDTRCLQWLSYCLKKTGNLEEAIKCLEAVRTQSRDPSVQIELAHLYYLNNNDERARANYDEALQSPDLAEAERFEAIKNLGNIQVRAGDFEAAEELYNRAYTIFQESDILMVNYGTLEIQREDLGAAVQRFRKAIQINSANDKAWVGLALVHRAMGDLDLSLGNLERALDINPKNRVALMQLVDWGVSAGRFQTVVDRIQSYLGFCGDDHELSFTLAKIFTHLNCLTEAEIELERTLTLEPRFESAFALKAALSKARKAQ